MKRMVLLVMVLLFATSVFSSGWGHQTFRQLDENGIYLDEVFVHNSNSYYLTKAEEFEEGFLCVDIYQLRGTTPCINATTSFVRKELITQDFNVVFANYDENGNAFRDYEIVTYEKTISIYDLDFNFLELGERIDGIVVAKEIDAGIRPRPEPELVVDELQVLKDRISELENSIGLLESIVIVLEDSIKALQDWACSIDSGLSFCRV